MLKVGDIIKCVKPIYGDQRFQDMEFTTEGIENDVIKIQSSIGFGFMSEDEYKKYFTTVHQWTPWIHTVDFYKYRTDHRKYVIVEKNGIRAKASCHSNDEFDLQTGLEIGLKKIAMKQMKVQ